MQIFGPDFPKCAHVDGDPNGAQNPCRKLAQDGYCLASCCVGGESKAYCPEHSHRPRFVLELLGGSAQRESYTRDEVLGIITAMWGGAGKVYESAGLLDLLRDVAKARAAQQQREAGQGKADSVPSEG